MSSAPKSFVLVRKSHIEAKRSDPIAIQVVRREAARASGWMLE
jgi:hypothetical protein